MDTQTKTAIARLLDLDKKCNRPVNKDNTALMDKYWKQVDIVVYNLLCERYEDETAEELLERIFKPNEKTT